MIIDVQIRWNGSDTVEQTSSPLRGSLAGTAKKAVCQALSASEAFGDAVVFAYNSILGTNLNPPNFAAVAKGLLCSEPTPVFPPGTSRPQGAQCPCVAYRIAGYLSRTTPGAFDLTFANLDIWGPIAGFVPTTNSNGRTGYNVLCRGRTDSACQPSLVEVPPGAGTGSGDVDQIVLTSVIRLDGGPDDCGTGVFPVPVPLPPTGLPVVLPPVVVVVGPTISPDIRYSPTVILFQPRFDVDLNLTVPFQINTDIDLGPIQFSPTGVLNLNTGDVTFNFQNGGPPSLPPGVGDCEDLPDPVRPVPPRPPTSRPKPNDPDVEESDVISAVQVTVESVSPGNKASVIFQVANPDIYAPNLGFVQFFAVDEDGNELGWSADIPVKNTFQLIPCPFPDGAKAVAGTPQPGVRWELTPVKKKIRSQPAG